MDETWNTFVFDVFVNALNLRFETFLQQSMNVNFCIWCLYSKSTDTRLIAHVVSIDTHLYDGKHYEL